MRFMNGKKMYYKQNGINVIRLMLNVINGLKRKITLNQFWLVLDRLKQKEDSDDNEICFINNIYLTCFKHFKRFFFILTQSLLKDLKIIVILQ